MTLNKKSDLLVVTKAKELCSYIMTVHIQQRYKVVDALKRYINNVTPRRLPGAWLCLLLGEYTYHFQERLYGRMIV